MYNNTKMKKVINESTIRAIVRESLKNYIKESMEDDSVDFEGWTPEDVDDDMEDMFLSYGNNNAHISDVVNESVTKALKNFRNGGENHNNSK